AVGGALLVLGGAVVMFSSGSGGAVRVAVKPLPEQPASVAAPAVEAPPPAVAAVPAAQVAAAPASEVKPSGSSVAQGAAAQAGTPVELARTPPAAVPAGATEAPTTPPAPVALSATEKKPPTPARPRPAVRSAPVAKGTLAFRIRPYAVVSLDGKVIGQTPLEAVEVPVGRHTLRLVNKELGKDVTKSFEVKADQLNVFKLNLEAE
ncbi:PEGA domain-containing protein, partial [Pyxidicoccus sp. 3LFB2]